jgi:hypothetical protein
MFYNEWLCLEKQYRRPDEKQPTCRMSFLVVNTDALYSRRDSAARRSQTAGTREPPAGKKYLDGGGNKAGLWRDGKIATVNAFSINTRRDLRQRNTL